LRLEAWGLGLEAWGVEAWRRGGVEAWRGEEEHSFLV